MITIDNVLVHLGTAIHVIRLHCEHLLQGVCGAISLERPDFHFTKTLPAELCLTTQGLLSYQTVWSSRPGMHLVIDKMVQLEHVHVTDGNGTIKRVAGPAIIKLGLAALREFRKFQHGLDLVLGSTIKNRRCHGHTVFQVGGKREQFVIVK